MKLRISHFEQNAKLFLSLPLDLIIDATTDTENGKSTHTNEWIN